MERFVTAPAGISAEARQNRVLWILATAVVGAYVVAFTAFAPLALQDYLNHLARSWVMADLLFHHGERFGAVYQFHFVAIPYILGDLFLATATELLGITHAAVLWSVIVFLSLPCALLFYLNAIGIRSETKALLLILSVYLSTDWFFLVGFLEFRLGLAVTLVGLGLAQIVRRRRRPLQYAVYASVVVLGYLTHLTTLVFLTAAIGTSAIFRLARRATSGTAPNEAAGSGCGSEWANWRTEAALLLPCGLLFVWHFSSGYAARAPGDLVEVPYIWDSIEGKLLRITSEFARFGRGDGLMLLLLIVCLVTYVGRIQRGAFKHPVSLELWAVAAMFIAMYLALPVGYPEAYYVDIRALPMAFLFIVFGLISLPSVAQQTQERHRVVAVGLAAVLAIGNLAYLTHHFAAHREWLAQYRTIIRSIPRNARVLPVYTHGPDGSVVPYLHAYSFAIIDRDDVVPYLQTGDTGNPEKYLRYRNRPYTPAEGWYGDVGSAPVDWRAVASDYDYLLVTKPFDLHRLPAGLTPMQDNASAALFSLGGVKGAGRRVVPTARQITPRRTDPGS